MDITTMIGFGTVAIIGIRQSDGTVTLGKTGGGDNISGWPATLEMPDGSIMDLDTCGPTPHEAGLEDDLETAWYR
jgi:hypothetical protein